MRSRLAGFVVIAALTFAFTACNQPANENVNTRANTNANNTNTTAVNTNANANTNTRRALTREEYEKNKESYQREAKEAGRKIGTGINDGWLWVKARFDLAAADDLRDSTIDVDVDNSVVTLSGTVASAQQKAKAESISKSVEGVKAVKNLLKVSPSGNTNTASKNMNRPANTNAPRK
jgi:hyperosmotically inducible protein